MPLAGSSPHLNIDWPYVREDREALDLPAVLSHSLGYSWLHCSNRIYASDMIGRIIYTWNSLLLVDATSTGNETSSDTL